MTEVISITPDSGEVIIILCEQFGYGKDYSIDALVRKCSEEMQKNNKSVLLIRKSVDSEMLDQMIEIIFK